MDDTVDLGMSLMLTASMTTEIAPRYTGLALEPDPWLQGALEELRRTVDDDFVAVSGLQRRVWSRIVTEVEADVVAGVDWLARTAS